MDRFQQDAARASSRHWMCSSVCPWHTLVRSNDWLGGTDGGRIPGTNKPRRLSSAAMSIVRRVPATSAVVRVAARRFAGRAAPRRRPLREWRSPGWRQNPWGIASRPSVPSNPASSSSSRAWTLPRPVTRGTGTAAPARQVERIRASHWSSTVRCDGRVKNGQRLLPCGAVLPRSVSGSTQGSGVQISKLAGRTPPACGSPLSRPILKFEHPTPIPGSTNNAMDGESYRRYDAVHSRR